MAGRAKRLINAKNSGKFPEFFSCPCEIPPAALLYQTRSSTQHTKLLHKEVTVMGEKIVVVINVVRFGIGLAAAALLALL